MDKVFGPPHFMVEDETAAVRRIGRYQAMRELGRGTMGVVYKGYDPTIGRTVALKTIAFGALGGEAQEFRKRLYAEASAAGALSHPNIVTIYDIVEENGTTAVAMEFIEGETLAAVIAERGPLPIDDALALFEQICLGLDYAGSRGIVHRDIKPANILVGEDGRPKIADFGIARVPTSNLTQTGMVLGSPSFMSPEQVRGLPLDRRSDLFSAATLFYEMIAKDHPFGVADAATTMYRIVHEPPRPVHLANPSIGTAVAGVIERALDKDPDKRYPTGADLVAALRTARSASDTFDMPLMHVAAARAQAAAAPPLIRRPAVLAAIGSAVVVAGAVVGIAVSGGFSSTPDKPIDPPATVSAAATAPNTQAPAPPSPPTTTRTAAASRAPNAASGPPPRGRAQRQQAVSQALLESESAGRASVAAPLPARAGSAGLRVEFEGQAFPVTVYVGDRQVGRLDAAGELNVNAGQGRIRAVAESVFLVRDFGEISLQRGERHRLLLPGLASAVVGVRGDVYTGVRIFLDERALPGPYPAQVPKLAAGPHTVRVAWMSGALAGKELKQSFEAKASGHFLIRAEPEHDRLVVQQVR